MICTPFQLPSGARGIICTGRPRRQKCVHCRRQATLQCDGRLANGKTCDAHICAECSTPGGKDVDFCREHAPR